MYRRLDNTVLPYESLLQGIARYDEEEYQGWVKLGVPTKVTDKGGELLEMNMTINDSSLKNEDHVFIESSMFTSADQDSKK